MRIDSTLTPADGCGPQVSVCAGVGTHAYPIGVKWGQFAATLEDALYWAIREITM